MRYVDDGRLQRAWTWRTWFWTWRSRAFRRPAHRPTPLDPRSLSEHQLRDIGLGSPKPLERPAPFDLWQAW